MYHGDNVLLHYSIHADADPARSALYRPFGAAFDPRRAWQPPVRRSAPLDRAGVVAAAREILQSVMHPRAVHQPAPCC